MIHLQELLKAFLQIREGLESLELHGRRNAALLVFCHDKCSEWIDKLEKANDQFSQDSKRLSQLKEGENNE